MLVHVQQGFKADHARKVNKFACLFHFLSHGRLVVEYETMQSLFKLLKMPHLSVRHCLDNWRLLIAENLHRLIMHEAREVLATSMFTLVTCDEVTTVEKEKKRKTNARIFIPA